MDKDRSLSILIPCYNVERYISKCLDSVISQSYNHLEVICINDGSTDNTLQILQKYAQQDTRVIVFDQLNQGISSARSLALSKATGDFILFVDGDDWLDSEAFFILMDRYKEEDLIIFSYVREFKSESLPKDLHLDGVYDAEFIQRRLFGPLKVEKSMVDSLDSLIPVWGKMYKKTTLPEHLEFKDLNKIGTWEDGFFNVEILTNCKKVLVVNVPLYHYRKSNITSITSLYKADLQKKWIVKFQLLAAFLKEHGKDQSYFTALNNRVCLTFLGLSLNEINSGSGFWVIQKKIAQLLKNDFYVKSFAEFDLKFLPFHWKLFYYFAKINFSLGVTAFAVLIHFIINKRN